jgi:hypothetical protein
MDSCGLSLATAGVAGAASGGELTTTVVDAAMGAFMALPAGALAALTLWSLGSVSYELSRAGTA